jgi:histidinol-phosphate aminotransferase
VPTFRPDIAALTRYEVGRPIEEVVREHGIDPADIVRLTANESPEGPFPGVTEAVLEALRYSNRYPDNDARDLGRALAGELGVDFENLLFGNGSVALLSDIANAVGGTGTNVVYGWPGFVMYRFAAIWAGSEYKEVPNTPDHRVDLDGIAAAIDEKTRLVFLCNPNNPTGTIRSSAEISEFVDSVPDSLLVVIDEAYHDFVEDDRYSTAVPMATRRDNVVVLRTFSKIYSLAAHRIGYAVGTRATLGELRKIQQPLTVSRVAQAAARASLGQPGELARRAEANAAGRHHLLGVLAERSLEHADSHTNFIYFRMPGTDSRAHSDAFTRLGVIIRPLSGGWMRVTVGSEVENRRFVSALDVVLAAGPS